MKQLFSDKRTVMTLDAGGTNFVFSAMKRGKKISQAFSSPSHGDNLERCLETIIKGFKNIKAQLTEAPVAISFAFPGPADYPKGIIGDLGNLPAFRGGVALGDMLKAEFNIPVFIQNDGNLYAYGEALGGLLPEINQQSTKQYTNLIGITLGTGFGAGLVHNKTLIVGDNSVAAEVWLTSNAISPDNNAEEGVSTRAIINTYNAIAKQHDDTLMPKDIYHMAMGHKKGNKEAANQAFAIFGTHLGDAIANLINLFDGLVVIGGGLTGASSLYMPSVMRILKGNFQNGQDRLIHKVFLLDDEKDKMEFLKPDNKSIKIPFSNRTTTYSPTPKTGIATSQIEASTAISLGAYAYALTQLDQ